MSTTDPLLRADRTAPVAIDRHGATHRVGDVVAAAAGIAATLSQRAAGPQVVVACDDRVAFLRAALGVWRSGRVVALPANLRPATVAQLAGADVFVHDGGHHGGLDLSTIAPVVIADDRFDGGFERGAPLVRLFTSGTTGVPKAIAKTAGQLVGEAMVLARTFDLTGARVLCTVPAHHIYGLLFGTLLPLVADATIVAAPALHAESVREAIARFGVDVLVSTPAQLRAFDVLDDGALASTRWVFSSGAPLTDATAAVLRDRLGAAPTEVFGASETGGIAFRTHHAEAPAWTPLSGVTVAADDEGRMLLRSPFLDPSLVQPHPTDDRVHVTADGFVHHGRLDDAIKIGGRRVALGDVTAKLLAAPGIADAVAIALPSADGRGHTLGVAVATTQHTAEDVRAILAMWFDATVLPRRIVCVPTLPRGATGKLSRQQVLGLLGEPGVGLVPRRLGLAGDRAEYRVEVDPALACFAGHFPDEPILPGAVLLDMVVLAAIEDAWPELGAPAGVPRAKFTEPIRPGDALRVELVRRGARVVFSVDSDAAPCASGTFVFAAPREPLE